MASTARSEADKVEHLDPPDVIDRKVGILANWIRESKFTIVFSGAGLSTSAGIPDFRSGLNTVLPTGPGAWEAAAAGRDAVQAAASKARWSRISSTLKAVPTPTHMALRALADRGLVKVHVSQNTDGLNRKSGLPPDRLAELHGNTNLEVCQKCGTRYLRDFHTREAAEVHDHRTSRRCDDPACGGVLHDSIINFGESLPQHDLSLAFKAAERADLCICLGSSLTVTPAALIPKTVAERGGKLVIVNLQPTPLDPLASLRIYGMVDDVMMRLLKKLDIPTPPFVLRRFMRVTYVWKPLNHWTLELQGLTADNKRFSFLKSASITLCQPPYPTYEKTKEPFKFSGPLPDMKSTGPLKFEATLVFHGHYGEPPLKYTIQVPDRGERYEKVLRLDFDTSTGEWKVIKQEPEGTADG